MSPFARRIIIGVRWRNSGVYEDESWVVIGFEKEGIGPC
jgi:hypothetical protein